MAFHLAAPRQSTPSQQGVSPFFSRYPANDLATFFKMLDEGDFSPTNFTSHKASHGNTGGNSIVPTFSPRFDIRDAKDAYHLSGELPGIEQKDVSIEFTDHSTLVISGRVVHEHQEGNTGSGEQQHQGHATSHEESAAKAKAKPVTVEDDAEEEGGAAKNGGSQAVTTTSSSSNGHNNNKQVGKHSQQQHQQPQHHYILRERSVGEFRRTFTFPGKVDQDAVKASLKDGVLKITVPKATFAKKTISLE